MADKTWIGTTGDYSAAANWSPANAPVNADNVRIPVGSGTITSGLDQSAVTLGDFIVEPGYSAAIASASANLKIVCTRFIYHGTGLAYIDIQGSTIAPQIHATASAQTGKRGLYLIGSAMTTLNVMSGSVGVAQRFGETSTVATVRCVGSNASVWCGAGTSLTTFYQDAGNSVIRCAATTVTCHGGTITTQESGAITTLDMDAGTVKPQSTGTITTVTCDGGELDFTGSSAARTVTNLRLNPPGTLKYGPAYVTITNWTAPSDPITLTASRP